MITLLSSKNAIDCHHLHKQCFEKTWTETNFIEFLTSPHITSLGYWYKKQLIGLLVISSVLDQAEIYTICVHPQYRRKNIANDLLNKFKMSYTKNIKSLTLEVASCNLPAIKFYKKYNFKKINIRKNYYQTSNNYLDAIIMKCDLA